MIKGLKYIVDIMSTTEIDSNYELFIHYNPKKKAIEFGAQTAGHHRNRVFTISETSDQAQTFPYSRSDVRSLLFDALSRFGIYYKERLPASPELIAFEPSKFPDWLVVETEKQSGPVPGPAKDNRFSIDEMVFSLLMLLSFAAGTVFGALVH